MEGWKGKEALPEGIEGWRGTEGFGRPSWRDGMGLEVLLNGWGSRESHPKCQEKSGGSTRKWEGSESLLGGPEGVGRPYRKAGRG